MRDEIENADLGEIDIVINNVVSTFFTRCHLNLKEICMKGMNVIYNQENKVVSMKLKKPSITASIWSSGKITCAGANSEEESLMASRKVARCLWRIGFETKFARFKIVNVLGTVHLPFDILLTEFSAAHPKTASYEPELHPGVTFKFDKPKASLKIFHTGSITIAASSAAKVKEAMELVYPLVYEYRIIRPPSPSITFNHTPFNYPTIPNIIPIPKTNASTSSIIPNIHNISTSSNIIINNNNNKNNNSNNNNNIVFTSLTTLPNTTTAPLKQNLLTNLKAPSNPPQILMQSPQMIASQLIHKTSHATPLNIITLPHYLAPNNNNNVFKSPQQQPLTLKRGADTLLQPSVKKYKSTPAGLVLLDE